MANIGVIGSGSWGTALAWLLHNNGHKITLWSYLTEETEMFRQHHQNVDKLPGVVLADDVVFTCDLEESIRDKELLVLAVPSPAVRSTSRNMKAHVRPGQIIVDVAKGIEEATLMTMTDIIEEVKKPGRDPRGDAPAVIFRNDVRSFDDLKVDMELEGTVRNVVDFGAFVDIGVKNDGLVHISEMSSKYIKHPMDVVSVGDTVKVRIIKIDPEKQKIGLSMRLNKS